MRWWTGVLFVSSAYTSFQVSSVGCLCWRGCGGSVACVWLMLRSGFLYICVSYDFDFCITRTIYGIKSRYIVSYNSMYYIS